MVEGLRLDKALIEPIYHQANPSQPIELGRVEVEYGHEEQVYRDEAQVVIRFTPKGRLLFLVSFTGKPLDLIRIFVHDDWTGTITLPTQNVQFEAFCLGIGDRVLTFAPRRWPIAVHPPADHIHRAIFHIFNFPVLYGGNDYTIVDHEDAARTRMRHCSRNVLAADGWKITIAAFEETENLVLALRNSGGFAITHMGQIEREDGAPVTSAQLDDLLQCLRYFLSFALGRWAGVALPIGFDKTGNRLYEKWGLPLAAAGRWTPGCSWFSGYHGQLLSEVFPGFRARWNDDLWNRPIKEALYWYLGANDRGTGIGVDTGVILAQTALELLAWTYCVQDRKMISEKTFISRAMPAADRFRLLASALGIPLEIPHHLSALNARRGEKWPDSMAAITDIRNHIVHPPARKEIPSDSYVEAWKLSLWYIEMVLLRLCGHNGKYANRIGGEWTHEMEQVPWSTDTGG